MWKIGKFGILKKTIYRQLGEFLFWQMYVVFHFCTYFHSEWLIMSIYSIRKIARECFRLFCFLQIFEHSGYHASEIKNEEENPAVECGMKQPKFRFDICGWRCKFWVTISIWEHGKWSQRVAVWVTYLGFTRRVLSPKFCYPNVQGVLGDLLDCFALWFKPLDHSFFIFPFCTTTHPAHAHFSWILSPVRASKTCTFCS